MGKKGVEILTLDVKSLIDVLNQALDGVSQAVQDPGQSGGEIEERTEECQDL